ncbi:MAG: hypothetical protein ACLUFU_03515 [Bacilli bacterium]
MRRTILFLIGITIVILTIDFLLYIRLTKLNVVIEKDITISQNSKRNNLDYIKRYSNGEIVDEETQIDTNTTGEKQISVTFKDNFGKKVTYNYEVLVIE